MVCNRLCFRAVLSGGGLWAAPNPSGQGVSFAPWLWAGRRKETCSVSGAGLHWGLLGVDLCPGKSSTPPTQSFPQNVLSYLKFGETCVKEPVWGSGWFEKTEETTVFISQRERLNASGFLKFSF